MVCGEQWGVGLWGLGPEVGWWTWMGWWTCQVRIGRWNHIVLDAGWSMWWNVFLLSGNSTFLYLLMNPLYGSLLRQGIFSYGSMYQTWKTFFFFYHELLWTSLACCMRIPCTMGWAYESAVRQFSYFTMQSWSSSRSVEVDCFDLILFQSLSSRCHHERNELTGQTLGILWNLWCLSSVLNDVK